MGCGASKNTVHADPRPLEEKADGAGSAMPPAVPPLRRGESHRVPEGTAKPGEKVALGAKNSMSNPTTSSVDPSVSQQKESSEPSKYPEQEESSEPSKYPEPDPVHEQKTESARQYLFQPKPKLARDVPEVTEPPC